MSSNPGNLVAYKSGLLDSFAHFEEDGQTWLSCAQCGESISPRNVTVVNDAELGHAVICSECLEDTDRICDSCGDWSTTTQHIVDRDTHYEYGTGIDEGPDLCSSCRPD
jgi:hypothetical protein